ncbi:protein of unknown function [Hyphomicrobium sp. MC1]|nr:protein of unknown function [Hyphomicrobium sp. MC1]
MSDNMPHPTSVFSGAGRQIKLHEAGRGGGSRTPDLRFWRPTLYQLSYTPSTDAGKSQPSSSLFRGVHP